MLLLTENLAEDQAKYLAARALFHAGKPQECISMAQENINNYTVSPYHVIKNCILIAGALDNWDQAEEWQFAAEHSYNMAVREATIRKDEDSLTVLGGLRAELDELDEFKQEDLTGMTKKERAEMMGPLGQFQDEDEEVEEEQYEVTEEELAEIAREYGLDTNADEGTEKMTDDMKKLELDSSAISSFSVDPPA